MVRIGFRKAIVCARRRAASEDAFALATVMFMLLAVFSVVSVGVFATIQTQSGTVRDQSTKTSFATAEAGLNQAVFRYNAYTQTPSASQPCVEPSGTALAVSSTQSAGTQAGWCNAV